MRDITHNYDVRGTAKLDRRMRHLQSQWGEWRLSLHLEHGANLFGPALFWVVWVSEKGEGTPPYLMSHRLSDSCWEGPLTAVEDAIRETDRLSRQAGVAALHELMRERDEKLSGAQEGDA